MRAQSLARGSASDSLAYVAGVLQATFVFLLEFIFNLLTLFFLFSPPPF